jgi:Glucodextranase, domain B/PASTA domain
VQRTHARAALIATVCVVALVGCGSAVRPAPPPVRLTIDRPADGLTTLADQVLVSGTAAGAATVLVAGRPVPVTGGSFSVQVPVKPGTNVIDVLAGAPRAQDAMNAVRVVRQLPVRVPNLDGQAPSAAVGVLNRLGLRPRVRDVGGFLQSLLPMSERVCATSPPAGRLLPPRSAVEVQIAEIC